MTCTPILLPNYMFIRKILESDWLDYGTWTIHIFVYCLTKISIREKRSMSRVFSLFIVPSPFLCTLPLQKLC